MKDNPAYCKFNQDGDNHHWTPITKSSEITDRRYNHMARVEKTLELYCTYCDKIKKVNRNEES